MAKSGSAFTGGKLSLKGEKKKKSKKKSSKSKHSVGEDAPCVNDAKKASSMVDEKQQLKHEEELTAAEKRSKSFKQKRERKEMEKIVSMSHRERVETFNAKLGELTEHNDIPRVSAAGNG